MASFATAIKPFPSRKLDTLNTELKPAESKQDQDRLISGGNKPQTSLPELSSIENRLVNKELETKRILINFILFFVLRLINKIIGLLLTKVESFNQFGNDYSQLISIINRLLQALFFWNISNGLYKVFKPQDEFKDLSLTNDQRKLLGLPLISLTKLEPTTTSTSATISLSPIKTKTTIIASPQKKLDTKTSAAATTPTKHTTPIASPMSSPSPLKKSLATKKSHSLLLKPSLQSLKKFDTSSTPTYIPSPKYYYRMDSPSRTRRI